MDLHFCLDSRLEWRKAYRLNAAPTEVFMKQADDTASTAPRTRRENCSIPQPAPLKRETILVPSERGRLAVLVALCSLAGVAVGFGLSNMAHAVREHRCPHLSAVSHRAVVLDHRWADTAPTWLGVNIVTADASAAATAHDPAGARVVRVLHGSPARGAGVIPGDVIVAVDGQPVADSQDLVHMIRSRRAGQRVTLGLERDGTMRQIRTDLARMPQHLFQTVGLDY